MFCTKTYGGNSTHGGNSTYPVSILYKSIAGRYWPIRVADRPITARYSNIKNASRVVPKTGHKICFGAKKTTTEELENRTYHL